MSGQDGDANNDCKSGNDYDLVLVEKVMRTIKQYYQDEKIIPDPASLRNSMLAIAALLHFEAIEDDDDAYRETFAEIASARLDDMTNVRIRL